METPSALAASRLTCYQVGGSRHASTRRVWVSCPPQVYAGGEGYPLALFFDGAMYAMMGALRMLTALRAQPTIAVFVDSVSPEARRHELTCAAPFSAFIATELLRWVQQRYPISDDPQKRMVIGASYGGLAASYLALTYPALFGSVLSQSGSFWWSPDDTAGWLTRHLRTLPPQNVSFVLQVGRDETRPIGQSGLSLYDANREFAATLQASGYRVMCNEFAGGHSPVWWQSQLAAGLEALLRI